MVPPDNTNPSPDSGTLASGVVSPETRQQIQDDMEALKHTAAHDVESVRQRAVDDVQNLKHQAQDQLDAAGEKAKSFAGEQKDMAADQLDGIASAISKVAGELDQNDQATISRYAKDLAGGIERISGTVRDHDTGELMGMAQDFGRSQPVAFLGAAALAGFVASRFALASTHRKDSKASPDRSGGRTGGVSGTGREDDYV